MDTQPLVTEVKAPLPTPPPASMSLVPTIQNLVSTKCGPDQHPKPSIVIKLGRGLGGGLEIGEGVGKLGGGGCLMSVFNTEPITAPLSSV